MKVQHLQFAHHDQGVKLQCPPLAHDDLWDHVDQSRHRWGGWGPQRDALSGAGALLQRRRAAFLQFLQRWPVPRAIFLVEASDATAEQD